MKKYLKVMLVLVVALSIISSFAFAANNPFELGNAGANTGLADLFQKFGVEFIGIVQVIGYAVAVIMVIVVGIQWVMGTPAKKQELKGRLINVVIGAILISCAVTLLGFINKTGNKVANELQNAAVVSEQVRA